MKFHKNFVSVTKTFFPEDEMRHCNDCDVSISKRVWNSHLKSNNHKTRASQLVQPGVEILKSAFDCRIISYKISSQEHFVDVTKFSKNIKDNVIKVIQDELQKHKVIKVNLEMFGLYYLPSAQTSEIKSHNTQFEVVTQSINLDVFYEKLMAIICGKLDEFAERDSGNNKFLLH